MITQTAVDEKKIDLPILSGGSYPFGQGDILTGKSALLMAIPIPAGKTWYLTNWCASGTKLGYYELEVVDIAYDSI